MDQKQIVDMIVRLEQKVDRLMQDQARGEAEHENMMHSLDIIKTDLVYHIRRTDILEEQVTKVKGFLFYFSVILGALATVTTAAYNIWRFFK